jgi:hypothetical protein
MRCPVCRADVEQGPQCRRCRADVSLLFEMEKQRRYALTAAYQSLHRGRYQYALTLAEGAEALRGDEETRRLRALIHLLERNFAEAWRVYTSHPRSS